MNIYKKLVNKMKREVCRVSGKFFLTFQIEFPKRDPHIFSEQTIPTFEVWNVHSCLTNRLRMKPQRKREPGLQAYMHSKVCLTVGLC